MRIQNYYEIGFSRVFQRCIFIGFIFLGAVLALYISPSYADLMINPTRIVLDEKTRSSQLELLNNGDKTVTYRIGLVNRRMDVDGKFLTIDAKTTLLPDEKFADHLLRFSPPQVTLAPGKSQIIRIAVRKPENLADGEYRSHLLFEQVPDTNTVTSIKTINQPEKVDGVSIHLTALFGATIPVIVRQGLLNVNVGLTDLKFLPPQGEHPSVLELVIHRSGNRSAYGDLVVKYLPDNGGQELLVGRMNGLAVYTPNDLRHVKVELKLDNKPIALTKGKLIAQFLSPITEDSKLLAEGSLLLP